jgi:hypothetical protein
MTLPLLIAAWLAPAPVAAAESPRSFVERLYASYKDEDFSPFDHPERIFAPPFVAALKEDARLSREEIGFIEADPLCQCQDPVSMRAQIAAVRRPSSASAEARLRLRFGASAPRDIRLKLIRTRAGWRVADIAADDEPSFLADLRAFNRRRRLEQRR